MGPEGQDINITVLSGNSQPPPDALGGNRVTWQDGHPGLVNPAKREGSEDSVSWHQELGSRNSKI